MVSIPVQGREGRKVASWELRRAVAAAAEVNVVGREGELVGVVPWRIRMLTAGAVEFVGVGGVGVVCAGVATGLGEEARAAPWRGHVLCVEHPSGGASISQR